MASQQEMQKIVLEMNFYRQKAEEIQAQMRAITAFVQESDSAKTALENLGSGETIFSVGSGIFVKAKPSQEKVLVEMGARVISEKTPAEAIAFLGERRGEMVKALSKLQEELEQLNAMMNELNEKAREMQKE